MLTPTTHQEIAAVCRLFGWPVPTPEMPGAVTGPPAQTLDHMLGDALSVLHVLILEQSGIRDGDGWWRGCHAVESAVFMLSKDCARYMAQSEALAADPTTFDGLNTLDEAIPF